jgi:hypothetical protein
LDLKGGGVTGGWRTLYNEKLHDLYSSPYIVRADHIEEDEVEGECRTRGKDEKCTSCRKTCVEETTRNT